MLRTLVASVVLVASMTGISVSANADMMHRHMRERMMHHRMMMHHHHRMMMHHHHMM